MTLTIETRPCLSLLPLALIPDPDPVPLALVSDPTVAHGNSYVTVV